MHIQEIRGRSILLSHYAGVATATGSLSTNLVAAFTNAVCDSRRVIGYGHVSVGRYAQGGLICERFAPRLLEAPADSLASNDGSGIDPPRAWNLMMHGEKPDGHGERCVVVGALDMALWNIAAKIAGLPLYRLLARRLGLAEDYPQRVPVYAGDGYPCPHDDLGHPEEGLRRFVSLGYTRVKIKTGAAGLDQDRRRIDRALRVLGNASRLVVDAMSRCDAGGVVGTTKALAPLGLWWFEDICDSRDFPVRVEVADIYPGPIGAGEALFSLAETRLLDLYSGLRRERDVLVFGPVHCYDLLGYLAILNHLCARGWPRMTFRPHAGYLFSLHLVTVLRLGWAEATPSTFRPSNGFIGALPFSSELAGLPQSPGIGFERQATLAGLFHKLLEI